VADRPALASSIERLRDAGGRILELRHRVEAGAPWPLAERFGHEPEASWGPPEVLAHLAEMLPFWLGEMERIMAAPIHPAPFGRVATDAIRTDTIGRDRSLPPRELFSRIASDLARYDVRLPELDAADVAKVGMHPRLGPMTVADVLERLVVNHLEEHAAQLHEALD